MMFVKFTTPDGNAHWINAALVRTVDRSAGLGNTLLSFASGPYENSRVEEKPHAVVEMLEAALERQPLRRCPKCNSICLHHVRHTTCAECDWKRGDPDVSSQSEVGEPPEKEQEGDA